MKITDEMIRNYKNYLITEEKSEVTIEKYIRDINTLSQWLGNREIAKQELLSYKAKLIEDYAPASVNSVIASINGFLMFHKLYDLKIKILKIQKQLFCQKEKELTKAEYERLLRAAKSKKNERLYLIMQTICGTGIRVSELKFITCEAVINHQTTVNLKGKIRIILLPKELCKLLSKYIKEQNIKSGPVFITRNGKPLSRHDIWRSMKALCNTAGVDKAKVFPHNLRHLFARTYYAIQKDIVRLADILGHSSINTTRIYTIEDGEVHRRQMQKLGLVHLTA